WIDCAVSARSSLTFMVCADSAERELDLMARAATMLVDSARVDSRRATAAAIRAAPPLTDDNMMRGEYVTGYSFLESLVPESSWDYLVLTDLEQTGDLVNNTFHPDSSDDECATLSEERSPRVYSYNALGKILVRTIGLGFCLSLPAVRRVVKTDAAKRTEVVRLLEGQ
ncbi:MAG: hypothetical protein WBG86_09695, partial [Polyangiales bacterium]